MRRTVLVMCVLILLWWATALALQRPFLPTPALVAAALYQEILWGSLLPHLLISMLRVLTALAAAFVPALLLGVLAGTVKRADNLISPTVYVLFPIPKIALLPIILLFLGLGNLSKVFFVALIVFFQFFLEIRDGTVSLSRRYFDSLYTLGGSKLDLLCHVILPAILPRIFSALRLTLGTAFAVLFLAETFATRRGIGWYIMDAWSRIAYDQMYAGILALSIMGLVLFGIMDLLQRRFCRWQS